MIGWTLCSGIGAPEVAAPWVDWRLAAEIEDFPRAVLSLRHGCRDARRSRGGASALWGDFTAIRPRHLARLGIAAPEILVAGTPCQAFSIVGPRSSLADARGNLTLAFVELVHAVQRSTGSLRWVLWENVPGVLSTQDNAFGCFLAGLVGGGDPLSPPPGGRWRGVGMVSGPRGRAAWRVLDAQHFGVPQRRRRVFVVFCPRGAGGDPAAVLFEPAGMRGDPAPGGAAGQDAAGGAAGGAGGRGRAFGGNRSSGPIDVAPALNGCASASGRLDFATEALIAFDTTQITSERNRSNPGPGEPCHPLAAAAKPPALAFSCKDYGADAGEDYGADAGEVSPPLRAMGHDGSHMNAGGQVALAFHARQDPDCGAVTHPLDTDAFSLGVGAGPAVRRLTPVEAERLQGFPDGFTAIPWRWRKIDEAEAAWLSRHAGPDQIAREAEQWLSNAAPDGRRFKALGNSMAVPVVRWILSRIRD